MKKIYTAPIVHLLSLDHSTNLMAGSPNPNNDVVITTPEGEITVRNDDSGIPDGPVNYSKKFDSWSAWDE